MTRDELYGDLCKAWVEFVFLRPAAQEGGCCGFMPNHSNFFNHNCPREKAWMRYVKLRKQYRGA